MLSRQDKRHIILMYVTGFIFLAICCAAVYKLIYEPAASELRHLHRVISNETPENIVEKTSLGHYQEWVKPLNESQQTIREQITGLVHLSATHLIEMRFDAKTEGKPFSQIPVLLKVRGAFPAVMSLLTRLANAHLIFSFDKLDLSKVSSSILASLQLRFRTLM